MRTTNLITRWYTTSFISNALKLYLEDHGYRILDESDDEPSACDEVIIATKIFGKEIIEVRGTIEGSGIVKEETESAKRGKLLTDAMNWLSDVILSPINFFASNYGDGKNRSLCLPDLEQYQQILENVKEYFVSNHLHLKVYLVNESGDVKIMYLNDQSRRSREPDVDEEPEG